MNWKLGAFITFAALVLIFVTAFYSGAFMHGD